jgi:simple sugar transport system substrate-binding protein/ribose transport system substrate-binding protein
MAHGLSKKFLAAGAMMALAVLVGSAVAVGGTTQSLSDAAAAKSPNPRLKGFTLAPYIKQHVRDGKKLTFVYITNDLSSSYTAAQRAGVVKAKKVLKVNARLTGPPTGAAQDQVSLIQTLVAQKKVDGIVVAAVNVDSLRPVIADAFKAGIPLISAFTNQPKSKQLAFVGEDNTKFGVYEGKLFANYLKGKKGKVVALSVDTAAGWSTERVAGLEQGLRANPGLEMVGPINTGIEPGQMYNAIQNAMQANPDAIAIASVDCCSIVGAAKWVENTGNKGKIPVIGTDALQQTLNYVKSGIIVFSISQDPVGQVFTSIQKLKDFITKGKAPRDKIMPPLLVTKKNASKVTPEG